MKQAITLFLISTVLNFLAVAQTPGHFAPGRYRVSVIEIGPDSTIVGIDSVHLAEDVSSINNGDPNKWTTTYDIVREQFCPGCYMLLGVQYDNPNAVHTLFFNKK